MANAHVLISSQTLGSAVASVTFGSGGTLPQGYRDLRLVVTWTAGSVIASDQLVQLNGDTSNTYTTVEMAGDGTTPGSSSFTKTGLYLQYLSNTATNGVKIVTLDLLDYTATDKHKTAISRASNSNFTTDARASRWPSTAAVTSLTVVSVSATFAAGSTFYLYGVLG